MRIRNSILYPILGVLVLIVSVATLFHYQAQVSLLNENLRRNKELKTRDLQFAIQTLIDKEVDKLSSLSQALKEHDDLVWEIAYYPNAEGNYDYLKEVMDRIFKGLNVDIFFATDSNGTVIYQAHKPDERNFYADYWGIVEVLDGQDILVTDNSDISWNILSMVPAQRDENLFGSIVIGTMLDNSFAKNISEATDVEVSLGSVEGIFASSIPDVNSEVELNTKALEKSLSDDKKIFIEELVGNYAVFYSPVHIVDAHFSLIARMDLSESQLLLAKHQRQITVTSLYLLLGTLTIGILLTLYHVRPLKKLAAKSEDFVRELSGDEINVASGNEIQHLVRSIDILVDTVKKYSYEQMLAEAALVDEKERLAVTIRSIGDAVISTDNNGKIVLINAVAEGLTGWEKSEAVGQPLVNVFITLDEKTRKPNEDFVSLVLEAERIIDKNKPSVLRSRDGSEKMISEIGAPIKDENGRVIGVVVVFSDITERLLIEEELHKAKKLESVGILAGGIAHDFNNILTAIMGNISLSKNYIDQDSKANKRLEEADRAAHRAKDLTYKLLTFSKGGAPVRKTASIEELVRESVGFILSGTSVKTMFQFANDLWPAEIDVGQISQVIQNLSLNANQAMPAGGTIKIRADNEVVADDTILPLAPRNYIKLSFSDSGIGISKKNIDNIFDPFFTTKQKGSGLGLATVYSIISNHEGYISVESELDKGTTFTIYLPAVEKAHEPKVDTSQSQQEEFKGTGKILVMDDEEIVREVAGEMLESFGFKVDFALHGEEALEKYKKAQRNDKPYNAVIMDLTIPGGMGGRETIEKILEIDPDVTAIVSSGYSNDPIMAEYDKHGFKGMVGKPFNVDELEQVLSRIMDKEKI
jgi:PAS domain S-box-containing protein